MDIILALKAIVMGLVEGLTEFLPISSTGHLILAGSLLNFTGEKSNVFKIVIQAAAMLAVWWEFNTRINAVFRGMFTDPKQQKFILNLVIAFLPLALLGLAFGNIIKAMLFHTVPELCRYRRRNSSGRGGITRFLAIFQTRDPKRNRPRKVHSTVLLIFSQTNGLQS